MSRKKRPAPGVLEHRPVEREQDDVGGGDVERDAEDPLQAHVGLADDPRHAVAGVRDVPAHRQLAAEVGIEQEGDHHRGQDPADRAARRLQHEQDRGDAEGDVEVVGLRGAAHELVERHERVAERDHRAEGQQPVGDARALGPGLLVTCAPAAVDEERQRERDEQEARPVALRRHRVEHPVDRVTRQRRAGDERRSSRGSGRAAGRASRPRTPRRACRRPWSLRPSLLHLDRQVPRRLGVQRVALAADRERAPARSRSRSAAGGRSGAGARA